MVTPRRAPSAETRARPPAARDPGAPPPLSPAKRAGVLVVVGTLAATILLAATGGTQPPTAPAATPSASQPPGRSIPPATPTLAVGTPTVIPVITPPEVDVLREREWTAEVTIPEAGTPLTGLRLRVFRNGREVLDPVRVRDRTLVVRRIPLRLGENRITVALTNAAGDGPRSAPVTVVVDDVAPTIDLREPEEGVEVNAAFVTVRGVTDPERPVLIRNPTVGAELSVESDSRGVFITEVRLGPGENRLVVSTSDAVGNTASKPMTVVRGDGRPEVVLTLRPPRMRVGSLPASIDVRVEVRDANRQPVDGAAVTFSISPSGLLTDMFQTATVDGVAVWNDVVLPREGAVAGNGFVTARAVLPSGAVATATKPFLFE